MRYKRTQVYLDPDDHRRLIDEARSRGISLAALIREIVSHFTRKGELTKSRGLEGIIGIVTGGEPTDIANKEEEYKREWADSLYRKKMGMGIETPPPADRRRRSR